MDISMDAMSFWDTGGYGRLSNPTSGLCGLLNDGVDT